MASSRRLPTSYNEKTFGAAGNSRDYTSLATWESDTDTNLVTATKGEVLTCYADASSYDVGSGVVFGGATANASYFRVLRAAEDNYGTPTGGVRFYSSETAEESFIFDTAETYFSFYDISVYWSSSSTDPRYSIITEGTNERCIGCMSIGPGGTNAIIGFYNLFGEDNYYINCYATLGGSGYSNGFGMFSFGTNYLYNCTSRYNKYGFGDEVEFLDQIIKNCIAQDNTTAQIIGSWSQTTCATSGVTFDVDGYHLDSSDEGAIGEGTDLSDDGNFAFDDDINGNTRTGTWDIGCDEYVSSGEGTNIQINIGDTWKDVTKVQINVGDSWKEVTKAQINIGDSWKTIF